MSFLSPLGALVALAVVLPLAAYALLEARARRVSQRIGLEPPALASRLGVPGAIAVVAAFLGIAAAQPVVSGEQTHTGRFDAQVFVLLDTSRSMLARTSGGEPTRLQRAKALALDLRHGIADVPVGIASLTDRALPHLFPTLDAQVFESTLRDAIGIQRPPPSGTDDLATDFSTLGDLGTNNYYGTGAKKRMLFIFSDGESKYFDDVQLKKDFEKGDVRVFFVHTWHPDEKIYLGRNNVDPGYRPDSQSVQEAQRVAADGGGQVLPENAGDLISHAKAYLGSGKQTKVSEEHTRVSLGPYVALAALLPLGFVLLRRNL